MHASINNINLFFVYINMLLVALSVRVQARLCDFATTTTSTTKHFSHPPTATPSLRHTNPQSHTQLAHARTRRNRRWLLLTSWITFNARIVASRASAYVADLRVLLAEQQVFGRNDRYATFNNTNVCARVRACLCNRRCCCFKSNLCAYEQIYFIQRRRKS